MTLIAIWLENETLWAASDTQISALGGSSVLTDAGSKILPLSIKWGIPDEEPQTIKFIGASVGFAFSGRVLPAMMTYALSNTCLLNLMSDKAVSPDLSDCAELVRKVAERFLVESAGQLQKNGLFSVAMFGQCPATQRLRAFEISPAKQEAGPIQMRLEEINLGNHAMIVMGSGKADRQAFRDRVAAIEKDGDRDGNKEMAPQSALKEAIIDKKIAGVGGALQMAHAVAGELILNAVLTVADENKFGRSVLGVDVDALEPVGAFTVSIPLLAG